MKLFILGILIATAWAIPKAIDLRMQELVKRVSLGLLFLLMLYMP